VAPAGNQFCEGECFHPFSPNRNMQLAAGKKRADKNASWTIICKVAGRAEVNFYHVFIAQHHSPSSISRPIGWTIWPCLGARSLCSPAVIKQQQVSYQCLTSFPPVYGHSTALMSLDANPFLNSYSGSDSTCPNRGKLCKIGYAEEAKKATTRLPLSNLSLLSSISRIVKTRTAWLRKTG
jgi:hypothetical protein